MTTKKAQKHITNRNFNTNNQAKMNIHRYQGIKLISYIKNLISSIAQHLISPIYLKFTHCESISGYELCQELPSQAWVAIHLWKCWGYNQWHCLSGVPPSVGVEHTKKISAKYTTKIPRNGPFHLHFKVWIFVIFQFFCSIKRFSVITNLTFLHDFQLCQG